MAERPAIHARSVDATALATLVRAALDGSEAEVFLVEPPRGDVPHTLRLESPSGHPFIVSAVPISRTASGAARLRLSPLDPLHVPELRALLDELVANGPMSSSASAIFDSTPPLPEHDSFDPEIALIGAAPPPEHEADADDMLTIPFRPSQLPPSLPIESAAHTTRDLPPLRSAFEEGGVQTNRSWPEIPDGPPPSSIGKPFDPSAVMRQRASHEITVTPTDPVVSTLPRRMPSLPPETQVQPQLEDHTLSTLSTVSIRSPRTKRGAEVDVAPGRRIAGKYEIQSLVGVGAVGAVYRASHAELGRTVAIKVLHPYYRTDPDVMAAFRTEARAASRLQHPNVTVVHDFGEEPDGLVYIVMEYLQGRTLQSLLATEGRLAPKHAIDIMVQVCAALASAHEWGIVHRDVKPDNIILVPTRDDDDGMTRDLAKVCDFGIAALDTAPPSDDQDALTAGTPEYMAPEQIAGHSDARTDQYACGIVLYELVTGAPPFTEASVSATLQRHSSEAPRPLRDVVPDVPPALEAVVLRAIEKMPERRFASMRELRLQLKRCLASD